MLKINFHPECDIPRFIEGAQEYEKIWKEDGEKITKTIESISGFQFRAEEYNAIILDNKPSGSYPLILLSSYSLEKKQSTLVHELTHKALRRNEAMKQSELENHKVLNLVLYDIWTELYGSEFADNAIKGEAIWSDIYKESWDWAMAFSKEERRDEYKKYVASLSK
jgi:hypothetical protein